MPLTPSPSLRAPRPCFTCAHLRLVIYVFMLRVSRASESDGQRVRFRTRKRSSSLCRLCRARFKRSAIFDFCKDDSSLFRFSFFPPPLSPLQWPRGEASWRYARGLFRQATRSHHVRPLLSSWPARAASAPAFEAARACSQQRRRSLLFVASLRRRRRRPLQPLSLPPPLPRTPAPTPSASSSPTRRTRSSTSSQTCSTTTSSCRGACALRC